MGCLETLQVTIISYPSDVVTQAERDDTLTQSMIEQGWDQLKLACEKPIQPEETMRSATQQIGQGWAESTEEVESHDPGIPDPPIEGGYRGGQSILPEYVSPSSTARLSDQTYKDSSYNAPCIECHHNKVHHTNVMKICPDCWAKAAVKAKYAENKPA